MIMTINIKTDPKPGHPGLQQTKGFTLVEIMIAITLSMFLIGGLIQVYASSKNSARIQYELSGIQSSQRFVSNFLHRDIRMAGYVDTRRIRSINPVPKFLAAGTLNGDGNDSDEITVVYESATDCLGNNSKKVGPNGVTITENHYYVLSNTLYCKGITAQAAQPIADGVVNMQILYGIDSRGADGIADSFVNASNIGGSSVVSVRIALLFKTTGLVKTKPEAVTYNLLDADVLKLPKSLNRFEVLTTTISLRNKTI